MKILVLTGIITKLNVAGKNLKGFTISPEAMKSAAYYIVNGRGDEIDQSYFDFFQSNNLDAEEIYNSDKNISGIALDPADIGNDAVSGTKTLIHEINQHLRNDLNGIDKSAEDEHYNSHRDPNLSDSENEKFRSTSSPENPPANSMQGKLNSEVDKSANQLKKEDE